MSSPVIPAQGSPERAVSLRSAPSDVLTAPHPRPPQAVVERHPIDALPKLAAEGVTVAVLKFWRRPAVATEASNSRSMGAGAANTFSG